MLTVIVTANMVISPLSISLIFYKLYEPYSEVSMTVHIWVEVVKGGFMSRMVLVVWAECGQVGTGEEILELRKSCEHGD